MLVILMGEIYDLMGSGCMMYISDFMNIGSRIQKLVGRIHTYRYRDSKAIS
jgi:hypothetical protein